MINYLQKSFSSLSLFSDIDWDAVTKEYEITSIAISFPEYLQLKAEQGDCPPYLYELAYYEMARQSALESDEPFPHRTGVYLNPTAHFLSLEFDVPRMLKEAHQGHVEIYERPQVVCLYRERDMVVKAAELEEEELRLLQQLENGPRPDRTRIDGSDAPSFQKLIDRGIVLELQT